MFVEKSLQDYIEAASSGAEVPGGGSVSAVVAALGASMGEMVGNFTAGKKKYAPFEAEVQEILRELERIRGELLACVDLDAEAFLKFNDVYAMPKGTEEEKAARTEAMQACLLGAMQPPLLIMRLALTALQQLPVLAEKGNQNLITDAGVAAVALFAAIRSARYNVMINLKWLRDKEEVETRRGEVSAILAQAAEIAASVEALVEEAL